ncbi:MAG: DinB family protein [Pyrinomonadaceae bacterium]|nr:DinB family protein [Pyrinomonadaceae bacterium]
MEGNQLLEAWDIHNRVNLYLLEAIEAEHLEDVSASKGRTVGEQFAHIHNVRLMWLKQAAPELIGKLKKIEKDDAREKQVLQKSIADSGRAMNMLLAKGIESEGKIKGFKPHVAAFLGYLISHESHHRGQIALSLKQSSHPLSKKISYGIWEWGVR